MNIEQVWGVVRTVLAATAGAAVVKYGYLDAETTNAVLGAIGVIVVAAWSIFSKKKPTA